MIIIKDQIIFSFVNSICEDSLLRYLRNYFGFGEVILIRSEGGHVYSPKLSYFNQSYYRVLVLPRPSEWFRELWIFNNIKGWDNSDFNIKFRSDNFQEFIGNVIKNGNPHYCYFVDRYYNNIKDIDDVVRTESFSSQFISSMNRGLKRNLSCYSYPGIENVKFRIEHDDYDRLRQLAEFEKGQAEKLDEINKRVIDNFF